MRRTGSSAAALLALVLAVAGTLGVARPAWAGAPEFTQRVDRSEVGTQDTFRLIVEARHGSEALPRLHAGFPNQRRSVDEAETKGVVELIDVHALHVVASDEHVPNLIVSK